MQRGNLAREVLSQDMEMCNVGIKESTFLSTVLARERATTELEENAASAYITQINRNIRLKRDLVWKRKSVDPEVWNLN